MKANEKKKPWDTKNRYPTSIFISSSTEYEGKDKIYRKISTYIVIVYPLFNFLSVETWKALRALTIL